MKTEGERPDFQNSASRVPVRDLMTSAHQVDPILRQEADEGKLDKHVVSCLYSMIKLRVSVAQASSVPKGKRIGKVPAAATP